MCVINELIIKCKQLILDLLVKVAKWRYRFLYYSIFLYFIRRMLLQVIILNLRFFKEFDITN